MSHILDSALNGKIAIRRREREGQPPAESAPRPVSLGSPGSPGQSPAGRARYRAKKCVRLRGQMRVVPRKPSNAFVP